MASLFEVGLPPVNGERVRQARELRSLTQTALAESLGVDQTMVAHIERGAKQPTTELLEAMATTLGMPARFFRLPTAPNLPQGSLLFRARAGVGKRAVARTHAHAELAFELARHLSHYAKAIQVSLSLGTDPIECARATRTQMGYAANEPAIGLVRAIERLGVLVIALPPSDDCDAFAVWGGPNRESPVMGLAGGRTADRTRMSAAHELGHLVLHAKFDGGTPALEQEAYQFAAELLMPASPIAADLANERLNLFTLAQLKSKWRVSMQALARRGRDLSIMSDRQYRYLMQQISGRGWRTSEPDFSPVKPEAPRALRKMAEVAFGSEATASTIARRFDLSESFVSELLLSYASAPDDRRSQSRKSNAGVIVKFPT
jgi:Zn-dependent peptidase ImmA (M78 family)/transcriptional regulator with XRE-family HTH domain